MSGQPDSSAPPRERSLLRRPWLWIAVATGLVALYAAVGFWVIPRVAAGKIVEVCRDVLGREATVGRVRFNPFRFKATIEGFDLRDRDGADLLRFDRLTVDFQASSLFRWAWTFREILIERPAVVARILTDGRPSIADLFKRERDPAVTEEPFKIPRVVIDRLAMIDGGARFIDQSRTPEFSVPFESLNLEVLDLITLPDESGDHKLALGIGTDGKLVWTGRQQVEPLELSGRVEIDGIPLARFWDWLEPVPALDVVAGRTDVYVGYDLRREPDGQFRFALADGRVVATDLTVLPVGGGEDWLTVPRAELTGIALAWPESTIEIGEARVSNPTLLAWLGEDGEDNWTAALASAPVNVNPDDTAPAAKDWSARIGAVEISGATVRFEDRSVTPTVAVAVTDASVRAEGITQDLARPVAVRGQATVNGSASAKFEGLAVPKPFDAQVQVALEGLDVTPFEPYAVLFPGADIRKGNVGLDGKAYLKAEGSPKLAFEGSLQASDFDLANQEGDSLLAFQAMRATGIRVTAAPEALRIRDVTVDRGYAKIKIDESGSLNLAQLTQATEGDRVERVSSPERVVPVEISRIDLRNSGIDFTDLSLILDFSTRIHSATGAIRDLSTTSAAPATVAIDGRVADSGFFKTDGTIRVADPFASTDLTVVFRSLEMQDFTPYSAEFAGYTIERGTLDLDIHYRIDDRRLVGDHRVVATDLTLGKKVEGTAAGLPVRLAIALLKDKNGKIDLEVPIEGTVDSPEFAYRKVFWQAFKKIMANVAKAPFRAIGKMFGREDEDLNRIGFAPGKSDLLPADRETLPKLAVELAPRSDLSLEIEGRYDPASDGEAIAKARLEADLDARRAGVEAQAQATGRPTGEVALESLFAENFGADRLEHERAKFMPTPAEAPPPPVEPDKPVKKRKSKEAEPPASPPAPASEFDAAGFYDALRAQLIEARAATPQDLEALGAARAEAIAAALTAPGGLDPAHVQVKPPVAVKEKKEGSEVVESEMTISAGDEPESAQGAAE